LPTADVLRSQSPFVHDIDMHVIDPAKLMKDAAKNIGGKVQTAGKKSVVVDKVGKEVGMDVKGMEEGYPRLPGEKNTVRDTTYGYELPSWRDLLIGEPIPVKQKFGLPTSTEILYAGKDYTGVLNAEKMNVQWGRKSKALMNDLTSPKKQYRIPKDFYDYYSQGKELQAVENVRAGKPYNTENAVTRSLDAWKDKTYSLISCQQRTCRL
jgi:hypothetical protein